MSYTRQVGAQPAQQGRVNPAAFGQEARAGAEAADAVGQMFDRMAKASLANQQVSALGQAQDAWSRQFDASRAAALQDGNPVDLMKRWETAASQAHAAIAGTIQDPTVLRAFNAAATKDISNHRFGIMELQVRRSAEQSRATLDSVRQTQSEAAANGTPQDRARAIGIFEQQLAGTIASGGIHADQGETMRQRFVSDMDEAAVRRLIATNPGQAVRALAEGSLLFPGLTPERKAILFDQADRRATAALSHSLALSDHAERVRDRQLRQQQAANFGELVGAVSRGEPLPVEQLQDFLARQGVSPEQYTFLDRIATQRSQGRDAPSVVLDLNVRMAAGENVQARIMTAASGDNPTLSSDTAVRLLRQNQEGQQQNQLTWAQREGFNQVNALVGGDKPLIQLTPTEAVRAVRAQQEYLDRVRGGEAPREVVQDMQTRYLNNPQGALDLPVPRFGGARPTTKQEAAAQEKAARERRDAGSITPADYAREERLLREYAGILPDAQQPAPPARPGSRPGGRQLFNGAPR